MQGQELDIAQENYIHPVSVLTLEHLSPPEIEPEPYGRGAMLLPTRPGWKMNFITPLYRYGIMLNVDEINMNYWI